MDNGSFARALTDDGASVLHYYCKNMANNTSESLYYSVFKKIIEKGADINHQNRFGEAPLHSASHRGNLKGVNLLLNEKDIKINLMTK